MFLRKVSQACGLAVSLALLTTASAWAGAVTNPGGNGGSTTVHTNTNTSSTSNSTSTSTSTSTSNSNSNSTSSSNSTSTSYTSQTIYTNPVYDTSNPLVTLNVVVDVAGTGFYQFSGTGEYASFGWCGLDLGGYDFDITAEGICTDGRCAGYYYSNGATGQTCDYNPYAGTYSYGYWGSCDDYAYDGCNPDGLTYNLGPGGATWVFVGNSVSNNTTLSVTQSQSQQTTQQVTSSQSQQVTQQTSQSVTQSQSVSTSTITCGAFTLCTDINTNTNTNTNTNVNTNTNTNTNFNTNTNVNTNTNTNYNYNTVTQITPEEEIDYIVNESWTISPIVLDLSGTGKLNASNGNWLPHAHARFADKTPVVKFDMNANGQDVIMEWVGPQAGLLVEPKADGTVDGSCLFGTTGGFQNGFEKLAVRDRNRDGVLTGSELKGLMVWVNEAGDGVVHPGELHTLDSLGITSIGCKHHNFQSTYVANGKTQQMWDWWPTALDVREMKVVARNK